MPLPPLILLHGYPFDHTMWDGVVAAIGDKAKVIAPDLPGFGGSPVATEDPSLDVMANFVAKLLDTQNIREVVVAGMSMGGYVALAFAERYRNRLAGLGLISTHAAADPPETQQARRALIEKVRREGTNVALEALLPKLFSDVTKNETELASFPSKGVEHAGVEGICWALEAMARRPDRSALLKMLQMPTLIVHGAGDKLVRVERARQMAEVMSDANYVELPDAGHASPLENPRRIADALLELLARAEKFLNAPPKRDERTKSLPGIIVSPTERGL